MKAVKDIIYYIKLYYKNGISFFPLFPRTKTPVVKHAEYYQRMPTKEEIKEWLKTYLNPSFWRKVWNADQSDPKLWSLKNRWLEALRDGFSKIGASVEDYEYNDEVNIAIAGGYNGLVLIDIEDASKVAVNPEQFFKNLSFVVVKTGKPHGYHLYAICHDWKENVKGNNGEIRCNNQYVVAPPSVHPNGCQYRFLTEFKLEEISPSFIKNEVLRWIEADGKEKTGKEKATTTLWHEIKEAAKKLEVVRGKRSDWVFALTVTAKAYLKDEKTAFEELLDIPIVWSKVTRDGDWDLDRAFEWWKKYEWDDVDKVSKISPLYALAWAERETGMKLQVDYKQLIKDYLSITREKGYGHLLTEQEIVMELVDILDSCVEVEERNGKTHQAVVTDFIHRIADGINNMFHLAAIEETDDLLIFKNGVYVPCEAWIKKLIQLAWDYSRLREIKPITTHKVNEIVSALKRKNYVPLSKFYEAKKYINVKNGLLNIETWKLEPHRPEVYFLTQLNAEWDENAKAEEWDNFLKTVTDEKSAKVLQEFAGYCLLPDCRFEKALAIVGPGGSGKSTFLEVIRTVLGYENTTAFSIHQLENERFARAELLGKLANIYNDLPYDYLAKSDIFKQLVSGDPIQVEKKYRQPFLAKLHVKLIFSANQLPRSIDLTNAFFRRWIIITFPNPIEKPDPLLKKKLCEDPRVRSYVLKWMVEGLKRLLEKGFSYDLTADEIAEYYTNASDSVAVFVNEHIEQADGHRVWHSELYEKYVEFCKKKNYPPVSTQQFSIRIRQLTNAIGKTKGGRRYWVGIRYVESKEEEEQLDSDFDFEEFFGGG